MDRSWKFMLRRDAVSGGFPRAHGLITGFVWVPASISFVEAMVGGE
jgi:hypothetical protein